MRFGIFVFAVSLDPANDGEVIAKTLRQVELAERLGYSAVFLAEHHFDGSSAYVDPLVFAAAVAARTRRIQIGFAVVQMALHHPVRLAEQTALLDHLTDGRLIVGTGRGSVHNLYEYAGFGVDMADGREMIAEAEDLLVKAWSGDPVEHRGRFWTAEFEQIRPRPLQLPHPPLVRATMSDESVTDMARLGRPILMGPLPLDTIKERFELYCSVMRQEGFPETTIEQCLDQSWVVKSVCVADTDSLASELGQSAHFREHEHARLAREGYRRGRAEPEAPPSGYVKPPRPQDELEYVLIAGSPETVRAGIAELAETGARNVLMQMDIGDMDEEVVAQSMVLFAEEVMPAY